MPRKKASDKQEEAFVLGELNAMGPGYKEVK